MKMNTSQRIGQKACNLVKNMKKGKVELLRKHHRIKIRSHIHKRQKR